MAMSAKIVEPEEQSESRKSLLLALKRKEQLEDELQAVMAQVRHASRLMGLSVAPRADPNTVARLDDALETLRREVAQLRRDVTTDTQMPQVGEGLDVKQMTQLGERLDEIARTLDQASERSDELKADILFPPIEDMSVRLVPSDSLDRLEEYRSDVNWAYLLAGAFLGAVMGILSNWATNEKFIITRYSKVLIGLFLILAVGSGVWAYNINRRARRVRDHMFYRGIKPMGNRQLKKEPLSADTEPKAEDDANQTR